MGRVELRAASGQEVTTIMEEVVATFLSKREVNSLQGLRDNFSSEFAGNPLQFVALSSDKRSYYFAFAGGRQEALLSLSKSGSPSTLNLASFGRIIEKDSKATDGWEYLSALMEQVIIPRGFKRLRALIMSKGGLKAFYDLQDKSQGKPYLVQVIPGHPGNTATVIVL